MLPSLHPRPPTRVTASCACPNIGRLGHFYKKADRGEGTGKGVQRNPHLFHLHQPGVEKESESRNALVLLWCATHREMLLHLSWQGRAELGSTCRELAPRPAPRRGTQVGSWRAAGSRGKEGGERNSPSRQGWTGYNWWVGRPWFNVPELPLRPQGTPQQADSPREGRIFIPTQHRRKLRERGQRAQDHIVRAAQN